MKLRRKRSRDSSLESQLQRLARRSDDMEKHAAEAAAARAAQQRAMEGLEARINQLEIAWRSDEFHRLADLQVVPQNLLNEMKSEAKARRGPTRLSPPDGVVSIVMLGAEHRDHLASFSFGGGKRGQLVCEYLPAALESTIRPVWALGIFDGPELVSVIVWRQRPGDPETWEIPVLATADGHTQKGHAERIKRAVLGRARSADPPVLVVTSSVRARNTPMLKLNAKLGATITVDPRNADWRFCIIPIT